MLFLTNGTCLAGLLSCNALHNKVAFSGLDEEALLDEEGMWNLRLLTHVISQFLYQNSHLDRYGCIAEYTCFCCDAQK